MRWSLFLQEYQFDIKHCRGRVNLEADYFSRNFLDENIVSPKNNLLIYSLIKGIEEDSAVKNCHDIAKNHGNRSFCKSLRA